MKKKTALLLSLILIIQFIAPSMEMNFFSDVAEAATRSKEVLPSVEYHNIN